MSTSSQDGARVDALIHMRTIFGEGSHDDPIDRHLDIGAIGIPGVVEHEARAREIKSRGCVQGGAVVFAASNGSGGRVGRPGSVCISPAPISVVKDTEDLNSGHDHYG